MRYTITGKDKGRRAVSIWVGSPQHPKHGKMLTPDADGTYFVPTELVEELKKRGFTVTPIGAAGKTRDADSATTSPVT